MTPVLGVAGYVLREAASRKFIFAFVAGITAVLLTLVFSLKMEVVDGALAATRLFGELLNNDIRATDVALRPLFKAVAYIVFYAGIAFGILSCSDFAPSLLTPGRVEHLLSLPLRRWQLLAGTYLGVMTLAVGGALYGAGGLSLILGFKTGLWTVGPLVSALIACCGFAAVYAVMLALATVVRSPALCAAAGALVLVGGIIAGHRTSLAPLIEAGVSRRAFEAVTLIMPRLSPLATAGAELAAGLPVGLRSLAALLLGVVVFGLAVLAVGFWWFEERDY